MKIRSGPVTSGGSAIRKSAMFRLPDTTEMAEVGGNEEDGSNATVDGSMDANESSSSFQGHVISNVVGISLFVAMLSNCW